MSSKYVENIIPLFSIVDYSSWKLAVSFITLLYRYLTFSLVIKTFSLLSVFCDNPVVF